MIITIEIDLNSIERLKAAHEELDELERQLFDLLQLAQNPAQYEGLPATMRLSQILKQAGTFFSKPNPNNPDDSQLLKSYTHALAATLTRQAVAPYGAKLLQQVENLAVRVKQLNAIPSIESSHLFAKDVAERYGQADTEKLKTNLTQQIEAAIHEQLQHVEG